MSRVFFLNELEGIATFWRIRRRDGVTLGFTSHDRDLWLDGILHRAAPGMLPSAIRRNASINADSAEAQGALSHDSISSTDLTAGRYDAAAIEIGAVDWENLDRTVLYRGTIGNISEDDNSFTAELQSAKSALEVDLLPRTSPTCRADFCGRNCGLSPVRFSHEAQVSSVNPDMNKVSFSGAPDAVRMIDGRLRWLDGPHAGLTMHVISAESDGLICDIPLASDLVAGTRAILLEGCDHTLATCRERFGNAVNFRGEPYLPGNDLLTRYPNASA